jgi:putative ABC transport system permease protein
MVQGKPETGSLDRGRLLVPELLAKGLGLKVGDSVVIVATNQDGAVNGGTFLVGGVLESATGPGGRDGYMHIDDARELLRIDGDEISEYAVRVRDFSVLGEVLAALEAGLAQAQDAQGRPLLQAHGWESLSPFAAIARMIDVMSLSVKLLLIALVLISIMNVMLMAVYERVREIGTVAAIGTLPSRILALHVAEGFLLGTLGAAAGTAAGLLVVAALNVSRIRFAFGRQQDLLLAPSIAPLEVLLISGLVIAIAVVASLQPAWKASRMTPIDALRHV